MLNDFEGLQYNEVKSQIKKFCSFSLGQNKIDELGIIHNKLALLQSNKQLTQAINMCVSYGSMPFGGIYDISEAINLIKKGGTAQPHELLQIAQQSLGITQIKKYMSTVNCEAGEINILVKSLTNFDETAREILRCIGYDGSINDNASKQLADIRRSIKTLQSTIAKKMAEFINKNSNYLQDNITATRNDRNVVLVKNTYKNTVEGLQYGTSSTKTAVYIEPSVLIPLNNQLQQANSDELSEINRILVSLSSLVAKDANSIIANTETLAFLDGVFARAAWGKEHNCTVGELDEENLCIEKARHPLIDSSKVIANSYHIIKPTKMILITGANTGGKTVSLKIIGLFSLLFLSAIPLPCDSACFPLFDNIFYDIGDHQSISEDLSTFSAHITKLAEICNKATKKSLVILDELGSATDPNEGQAIASAVLDYLRTQEVYVVATTHFSKLKAYGKQYNDIMISAVEFDQASLTPTYHYLENVIGQSNAIEIARRYGLKSDIIQSAYDFKAEQMTDSDKLLEKLQDEIEEVRSKKQAIEIKETRLKEMNEELTAKQDKLKNDEFVIIADAKDKANEIIIDAQKEVEDIINQLKQQQDYDINKTAVLKHRLKEIMNEDDFIEDRDFAVNDYVRINQTNQQGEIIELRKNEAIIDCSGLKINSKLSNLVKISKPKQKEVVMTKAKKSISSSFSMELNLVGYRVDEALAELDKYLDNALVSKAPYVRIIHGYGTGALRKAIWDKLKKYPYISKFEFASSSEGSSGATIVHFKD